MPEKCSACQSQNLTPGRLSNLENLTFIPAHPKYLATTSNVKVNATVCADCGNVMLTVDTEELGKKADIQNPE